MNTNLYHRDNIYAGRILGADDSLLQGIEPVSDSSYDSKACHFNLVCCNS